ncbi:MAG: hypothetical protein VX669_09520 [Planctomycetota bacterium]|nr:hypothetical protein [Planctomycetota bacterium]
MTDPRNCELLRRPVIRGLCVIAVGALCVGRFADAGDGRPVFRAPRFARGPVFAPPPAPPTTLTVQSKDQPKVQPKVQPKPTPPKAIPVPARQPAPQPISKPSPMPELKSAPVAPPSSGWVPSAGSTAATVRLYRCVKYKDTDEIPENAIPLVIQVPDPRGMPSWMDMLTPSPIHGCAVPRGCAYPAGCAYPRGCAYPVGCAYPRGCARPIRQRQRMVNIKICAPQCGIECLRVGQHVLSSRRIRYDFGEYKVDIRLKGNGWIEVKYDN